MNLWPLGYERQQWWVAYGLQTHIRCGSELLIFVAEEGG
jgi:hypothetical protein